EIHTSIDTIHRIFGTTIEHPGLPRYENDSYRRTHQDSISNPWLITTLWKAQYDIEIGELDSAENTLDWANRLMLSTGMLGEQIDPTNNEVISPTPLTWSHAEYV